MADICPACGALPCDQTLDTVTLIAAQAGPDRHKDDGCSIAFNKWWAALTLRGATARRGNLSGEAFEAGWVAAMAEVKEAEAFHAKIRDEERRQEAADQSYDRWWR